MICALRLRSSSLAHATSAAWTSPGNLRIRRTTASATGEGYITAAPPCYCSDIIVSRQYRSGALRTCSRCKESKSLDQFEKDKRWPSGRGSRCRPCAIARKDPAWSQSHAERNRERLAERRRQYHQAHREQDLEKHRRQRATEKGKARQALKDAVKAGKLVKPTTCERCNKFTIPRLLHAHHHDYSKPLDVRWYCSVCHGWAHRKHNGPSAEQEIAS
jgi:hypothetical protein